MNKIQYIIIDQNKNFLTSYMENGVSYWSEEYPDAEKFTKAEALKARKVIGMGRIFGNYGLENEVEV